MIFKSKNRDANVIEFKHRYKWRTEELIIVGILYAAAVAAAVFAYLKDMDSGLLITAGVVLLAALAVTYLGASRKYKSRLMGTYKIKETELAVSGHGLSSITNRGSVNNVSRVYVKKVSKTNDALIDPKDTIILASKTGKKITIPMRLAQQPGLYEIIETLVTKTHSENDAKVKMFMETAKTWRG